MAFLKGKPAGPEIPNLTPIPNKKVLEKALQMLDDECFDDNTIGEGEICHCAAHVSLRYSLRHFEDLLDRIPNRLIYEINEGISLGGSDNLIEIDDSFSGQERHSTAPGQKMWQDWFSNR